MDSERANDREMPSAASTAERNPMRPPESLPRDWRGAARVFIAHPSPQLIVLLVTAFAGWRIWLGDWGWGDALVALAVLAYFPLNEWLIHVFMLHFKPRRILGREVDFYLPKTHRRHHADPWNLKWVFIPRHIHLLAIPEAALILWLLWPWKELALTGLASYLLLGLHYEFVHYLSHIPWCPPVEYYRRRVREHRYHHFRNENYWWGVSFGQADRWLGTAPPVEDIRRSGTTSDLGMG